MTILFKYLHDGITNLLFPLADLDFHEFLLLRNRLAEFENDHTIFKAAHGISDGFSHLHDFPWRSNEYLIGYHHDIKPRNILIRGSTFVLADLRNV